MFNGILTVVILLASVQRMRTDSDLNHGKSTCFTEDQLQMMMTINKHVCSSSSIDSRPNIAFHAFLKGDTYFTGNDILKFDVVTTNRGNQYNRTSGIFTAPKTGLYQISCWIIGLSDSAVTYQINKNNDMFVNGYTSHADYSSNALNVLMELKRGDQVYVKHRAPSRKETAVGNRHSYFSGYMIL